MECNLRLFGGIGHHFGAQARNGVNLHRSLVLQLMHRSKRGDDRTLIAVLVEQFDLSEC